MSDPAATSVDSVFTQNDSKKPRESWGSQLGFMLSGASSAVGLANIWRFPYVVGEHGGAAFIIVYLFCLLLVGLPVFITEIAIGRHTQKSPYGAFSQIGQNKPFWKQSGKFIFITGFLVSAFYSVIAGWILGYLFESIKGSLHFSDSTQSLSYFTGLIADPVWTVICHSVFMFLSASVVYIGVQKGIERSSKWMMPLLFIILIGLIIKGFFSPGSAQGLSFLFSPNWSLLSPNAFLIALGHAFFTLSLGQGTMITYGSYLSSGNSILKSCFSIALIDTLIALMAGMAIFMFVFSVGMPPSSGPALLFQSLPLAFSQIPGGYFIGIAFFLLVTLAALSSQISVIEPLVAHLIDEKKWSRKKAVTTCGISAFIFGIPCALSTNVLAQYTLFDKTVSDWIDQLLFNLCIPIGGFLVIVLGTWYWGTSFLMKEIVKDHPEWIQKYPKWTSILSFCLKYITPLLIFVIFLDACNLI